MKKLLLSLATVAAGLFTANAATVTFDFTSGDAIQQMNPEVVLPESGSTTGTNVNNVTFSLEGINITGTPGSTEARIWITNGNAFQYRLYKNATMTVASDKTITEIKISSNGNNNFSATGYSGGTWSGSSNSVAFSVTNNVQISSITVTYVDNSTGGGDTGGGNTGDDQGETVTATYIPMNMGYTNAQAVTSASVDGIEFAFSKASGSTAPSYYTAGNALRLYGGNTMTITASNGTITKIEFTFDSGETSGKVMTADPGTFSGTTWEGSSKDVIFTVASGSGHRRIASVTVYYISESGKKAAGLAFPQSEYSVKFGETFNAPKATSANGSDGAITYTSSDPSVATVDENSGAVTIIAVGNTIITATIAETDAFAAGSAVYTLNVTPATIWTVSEALAAIEEGYNGTAQVKGYITSIQEVSAQYGNATYFIADEKGGSPELEVYRGNWMNGEKFTSEDQIEVDGLITVEGTLVNYNGTYEFTTGSKVIAYEAPDNGGDNPDDPTHSSLVQNFTTNLGFPEGSANKPTTPTEYTATDTGITYTIMGCYANSGYLMLNGKDIEDAFISWTLETNLDQLSIKTTSGCSESDNNAINFFAKPAGQSEFIQINKEPIKVNVKNATIDVLVPWDFRWPGTTYKVQYNKPATGNSVNSQFASFTYGISTGVEGITSDNDATPVYYNLQGVRVNNPEKGIYIVVKGNKAYKVIF